MGEAANAGRDSARLYPTVALTQSAASHARGTTYRDTWGAEEATTHRGLFVAGKHVAHRTKGVG